MILLEIIKLSMNFINEIFYDESKLQKRLE